MAERSTSTTDSAASTDHNARASVGFLKTDSKELPSSNSVTPDPLQARRRSKHRESTTTRFHPNTVPEPILFLFYPSTNQDQAQEDTQQSSLEKTDEDHIDKQIWRNNYVEKSTERMISRWKAPLVESLPLLPLESRSHPAHPPFRIETAPALKLSKNARNPLPRLLSVSPELVLPLSSEQSPAWQCVRLSSANLPLIGPSTMPQRPSDFLRCSKSISSSLL